MNAEHWLIGPQLIGVILFVIGITTKCFPPRRVNHWYGYRMPSSMENQQKWDEANCYSSKLMVKIGVVLVVIGLAVNLLLSASDISEHIRSGIFILLTIIASGGSAVMVILLTEKHLERKFDKH
ncbi:MAG: SdpI family protein [Mucilaginibacter sp.]